MSKSTVRSPKVVSSKIDIGILTKQSCTSSSSGWVLSIGFKLGSGTYGTLENRSSEKSRASQGAGMYHVQYYHANADLAIVEGLRQEQGVVGVGQSS